MVQHIFVRVMAICFFPGGERGTRRRIGLPALIACGRQGEAAPETCAYYQSRLPGLELAILEIVSHRRHLERPGEYPALVRDFLRRAEEGGRGPGD